MRVYSRFVPTLLVLSILSTSNFAFSVSGTPRFTKFHVEDGLPGASVSRIFRDSQGFMWFGGSSGLSRYDGVNFVTFTHDPDDPHSIGPSLVRVIQEDRDGFLWIGTRFSGLYRFDPRSNQFQLMWRHDENVYETNDVIQIAPGEDGVVWFVSVGLGLHRIDPDGVITRIDRSDPKVPGSPRTITCVLDGLGRIWIGRLNGLEFYDPKSGRLHVFQSSNDERVDDYVVALHRGGSGRIWVGTYREGLHVIDPQTMDLRPIRHDPRQDVDISISTVTTIWEDQDAVWIGTNGGGLYHYDLSTDQSRRFGQHALDPFSLDGNTVLDVYVDPDRVLWVGCENGGLAKWDQSHEVFGLVRHDDVAVQGLPDKRITSLDIGASGIVWLGVFNDGMIAWNPETLTFKQYRHVPGDANTLSHNHVMDVLEVEDGRVWIGTYGDGVNIFDPRTERFERFLLKESDDVIGALKIYEARSGKIWIGSFSNGAYGYSPDQESLERISTPDLTDNAVISFFEDETDLWIGTLTGGLNRKTEDKVRHYVHDPERQDSLGDGEIRSIIADRDGRMWIGTSLGVSVMEGDDRFRRLSFRDGLPDLSVNGLLEDAQGFMWIATNSGLVRYDDTRREARVYGRSDGLASGDMLLGGKDNHGDFYSMGFGAINRFDPIEVGRRVKRAPKAVITTFDIFNQPAEIGVNAPLPSAVHLADQAVLDWSQRLIRIGFAGLQYASSQGLKYAYQMEGVSDAWIELGVERSVTFSELAPGQYTFRVRARNDDGVWSEQPATLAIKVRAPWWRSSWAYSTYALFILSAGFTYRRHHLRNEQLLEDRVQERTEALAATNRQILQAQEQLVLQEKMASLGSLTLGLAHEFRNPLNFINNFSSVNEDLVQEIREQLGVVGDENLEDLMDDLSQNTKTIGRHGLRLDRIVTSMQELNFKGKGDYEWIEFNDLVSRFVDLAIQSKQTQSGDLGLLMCLELDEPVGDIYCVPQDLGRMVVLLVNNAIESVTEHKQKLGVTHDFQGRVYAKTWRASDHLYFCVADNGGGVAERHMEEIFMPFFTTKSTQDGHIGLGLSLAYDIAKATGGDLTAKNIREGFDVRAKFPVSVKPLTRLESMG